MLLDHTGRPIPAEKLKAQPSGRMVTMEPSDRHDYDASRRLTPAKVDQIMTAANSGDIQDQCRLALELEEKHWDIFAALDTRRRTVTGVDWSIEPGADDDPKAKHIAEEFAAALNAIDPVAEVDTFTDLTEDMMTALVPGFAVSEIIWGKGGRLDGFGFVEQRHFTARPDASRESWNPASLRLETNNHPEGAPLSPYKFVVHRYRRRGGDVARGGLIRPLAWMHCFSLINMKDLQAFVERYGMPFVVARVDKETWDNELTTLKRLIKAFGPSGGGVFTRSTELDLLQAANNTGDVYFKLLEYFGAAIRRIIQGQTATSGDGGGFSKDNAQAAVRQDILEADCRLLDTTQTSQIAVPWTYYNFGPDAIPPRIVRNAKPPEDIKAYYEAKKARYETMGVAIRGGMMTPDELLERAVREELELPEMSDTVKAEWERLNGVRRPITLKYEEVPKQEDPQPESGGKKQPDNIALSADRPSQAPAKPGALPRSGTMPPVALRASDDFIASGAVRRWLEPLQKQIEAACNEPDEAAAAQAILDLAADPEAFFAALDSRGFRESIENTVYASCASGMAEAVEERD